MLQTGGFEGYERVGLRTGMDLEKILDYSLPNLVSRLVAAHPVLNPTGLFAAHPVVPTESHPIDRSKSHLVVPSPIWLFQVLSGRFQPHQSACKQER